VLRKKKKESVGWRRGKGRRRVVRGKKKRNKGGHGGGPSGENEEKLGREGIDPLSIKGKKLG